MKKIIFSCLCLFSCLLSATETSSICTDFTNKNESISACGPGNLKLDIMLNDISKKYGAGFSQLRIIGWDDKNGDVFLAASQKTLLEKVCYFNLDKIFKYNLKKNSYDLLWDTRAQLSEVLDHINSMTVVKHSVVKSAEDIHSCDPLLFVNKVSQIGKNLGSRFNPLIDEKNYILIPGIGHPTVYFFSSDLKKLIGSFFIPEEYHILMDAVISKRGTLYSILRDMPKQLTCIAEFDLESGATLRKKCAPKNMELIYLTRGINSYVLTREFQKAEHLISIKDWFSGESHFYRFMPKGYLPNYFFPHMKIQQE